MDGADRPISIPAPPPSSSSSLLFLASLCRPLKRHTLGLIALGDAAHATSGVARPFVAKHRLLMLHNFAIQDLAHGVRRDERAVGAAYKDHGMEMPGRKAQRESAAAREPDAGVEAAERICPCRVIVLGRNERNERRGKAEQRRGDTRAKGDDGVGLRGAEIGQTRVAVYGGGDEEVRVGWVRACDAEDVGAVQGEIEPRSRGEKRGCSVCSILG